MPLLLALLTVAGDVLIAWEIALGGPLFDATAVLGALALSAAAAWAAWLAIHLAAELLIALPGVPDTGFDAHLLRLLARVASVLAVALVLFAGASSIGVPALGLLAGVSVGGVALALAAQSTVENLFGGFSIFADRPFRVGDLIRGDGVDGRVEAVGARSSRIRGPDGTLTVVPNGGLAKMRVTNVSARDAFLFQRRVHLGGETTRAQLLWLLAELRRRLEAEPRVERRAGLPRVRLVGLGETAPDIETLARVPVAGHDEFLEVQEGLILDVMRAVEDGGMRFAFMPPPAESLPQGGVSASPGGEAAGPGAPDSDGAGRAARDGEADVGVPAEPSRPRSVPLPGRAPAPGVGLPRPAGAALSSSAGEEDIAPAGMWKA